MLALLRCQTSIMSLPSKNEGVVIPPLPCVKFQHWKIALITVHGNPLTFENSLGCLVTGEHSSSIAIGSRHGIYSNRAAA